MKILNKDDVKLQVKVTAPSKKAMYDIETLSKRHIVKHELDLEVQQWPCIAKN